MLKKILVGAMLVIAVLIIAIQLVPYGHTHTDPAVQAEPAWDSPQTRQLAQRACFDCHSNETMWPWYSNIAPISWLIQRDVDEGRRRLNFSEWNRPQREVRGASREVQRGVMPPSYYVMIHPSAKLSPDEIQALTRGLSASLAQR
jgi:mono/diheme cytochrome c family protein